MLWAMGALAIFVAGGLTGVMVAVAPFDFQAHDTYFVVAHLHFTLFGGMLFPLVAGIHYYYPLIDREHAVPAAGHMVLLDVLRGVLDLLLAHAPHRPEGDAAAGLHLSGGGWGGTG